MSDIVAKLESREEHLEPEDVEARLLQRQEKEIRIHLVAETLDGMKKRATVALQDPEGSKWSILCDEGAQLGGEDSAPPPLIYFSAAIAF